MSKVLRPIKTCLGLTSAVSLIALGIAIAGFVLVLQPQTLSDEQLSNITSSIEDLQDQIEDLNNVQNTQEEQITNLTTSNSKLNMDVIMLKIQVTALEIEANSTDTIGASLLGNVPSSSSCSLGTPCVSNWIVENWDDADYWNPSNATRIYIPEDGRYNIGVIGAINLGSAFFGMTNPNTLLRIRVVYFDPFGTIIPTPTTECGTDETIFATSPAGLTTANSAFLCDREFEAGNYLELYIDTTPLETLTAGYVFTIHKYK